MRDQAKALHALQTLKRNVQAARVSAAREARRRAQGEASLAMENHKEIRSLLLDAIREGAHRGAVRRMEGARAHWAGQLEQTHATLQAAERTEAQETAAAVAVEKRIEGLEHVLGEFALLELFAEEEE